MKLDHTPLIARLYSQATPRERMIGREIRELNLLFSTRPIKNACTAGLLYLVL